MTVQALRNPLFSSFYTAYSDGREAGTRCKEATSYTRGRRHGKDKDLDQSQEIKLSQIILIIKQNYGV
jgi:hypothetical protein